mgnify:FL=1
MIFDTDVLIWAARGNVKASKAIENSPKRQISTQTYLELLQCATDKRQQSLTRRFLRDFAFEVLPLTSGIGVRSCALIEQFAVSHSLRAGDAVIAATAIENDALLCTTNVKHYRQIPMLTLFPLKVG